MRWLLCKLCLFAAVFVCSTLSASLVDSMRGELITFLRIYDISQEKLEGWTSVAYAIEYDFDAVAEYLIEKGENFDGTYKVKFKNENSNEKEGYYYKHPFYTAIAKGKIFLVTLMISKDSLKRSWHSSAIVNRTGILKTAIIDSPNPYEMVQFLLKAGASPRQSDSGSFDSVKVMPLTYAISKKQLDIATLLFEHDATADPESLSQSIRMDFIEGLVFLLERGAKVDKTALWFAIRQNNFNALALLLDVNSDVDFEMISFADMNGYSEIADILMNAYTR